ncbi:general amidase [Atractiella rhizophila]|nr:general amidase [Atractiella rhizophila]
MFAPSYTRPQDGATEGIPDWYARCLVKRKARDDLIPASIINSSFLPPKSENNVLSWLEAHYRDLGISEKEWEMTQAPLEVVAEDLRRAEWRPTEVLEGFIKRATYAQLTTNCLTEIWFDEARARAQELEEEGNKWKVEENGEWNGGALWGVPISLKDQFEVEGKECTMGYASWIGRISPKDSTLVTLLKEAGAILYCRTNVPQTLMWGETDNYVFGRTDNPRNRTLTAGGSSGGEGALLALGGSPGGFGTDIGGSVRIPAVFNHLFSLRPTTRIIPYRDVSNTLLGMESVESTIGPMARTLGAVELLYKAIVDAKPWEKDPKCVRGEWRGDVGLKGKLCFGVMEWDEIIMPHPPLRAALRKTVDAVKRAGHNVVTMKPMDHLAGMHLLYKFWLADAGESFRETMKESNETIFPGIVGMIEIEPLSAHGYHQANIQKEQYRNAYHDYWQSSASLTGTGRPVDALLFPAGAQLAPPHGRYRDDRYVSYTAIWNFLDYPTLVIPMPIDPSTNVDDPSWKHEPVSEDDASNWKEYLDHPELFKDAPVAVQLVGRRWGEEELLGFGKRVVEALDAVKT